MIYFGAPGLFKPKLGFTMRQISQNFLLGTYGKRGIMAMILVLSKSWGEKKK